LDIQAKQKQFTRLLLVSIVHNVSIFCFFHSAYLLLYIVFAAVSVRIKLTNRISGIASDGQIVRYIACLLIIGLSSHSMLLRRFLLSGLRTLHQTR